MTALHRLIGHHLVQRACPRVPDALRAREQLLPELGQGDAARLALEQRQAEQILERADRAADSRLGQVQRSEEHTSELQSLMRISYAVFCLKKKTKYADKNIKSKYTKSP